MAEIRVGILADEALSDSCAQEAPFLADIPRFCSRRQQQSQYLELMLMVQASLGSRYRFRVVPLRGNVQSQAVSSVLASAYEQGLIDIAGAPTSHQYTKQIARHIYLPVQSIRNYYLLSPAMVQSKRRQVQALPAPLSLLAAFLLAGLLATFADNWTGGLKLSFLFGILRQHSPGLPRGLAAAGWLLALAQYQISVGNSILLENVVRLRPPFSGSRDLAPLIASGTVSLAVTALKTSFLTRLPSSKYSVDRDMLASLRLNPPRKYDYSQLLLNPASADPETVYLVRYSNIVSGVPRGLFLIRDSDVPLKRFYFTLGRNCSRKFESDLRTVLPILRSVRGKSRQSIAKSVHASRLTIGSSEARPIYLNNLADLFLALSAGYFIAFLVFLVEKFDYLLFALSCGKLYHLSYCKPKTE